jgi:hypothetical protein
MNQVKLLWPCFERTLYEIIRARPSWFCSTYVLFWVFPRRPIVVCRRFGTLYRFHLQGLDVEYEVLYIQPLKMELIEGSETSANYNRTPGKYPKEYIQDKVCWKSSKSIEKRSKMKWKSSKNVVKWNEVKCSVGKGENETLWEKFIWVVKWWEVKGWCESVIKLCVGKNTRKYVQYFLTLELFTFCTCCILRYLMCIVVSCRVCIVVFVLCVLLSSYVYLLYYVCIAVFYFRCRTAV